MVFVDTHCHLNSGRFDNDLPAILERANQQGVSRILVPGSDLEDSTLAVGLAEEHPGFLYASVGVHPSNANSWNERTPAILRSLAKKPGVVAIGEIGLDYYRNRAPRPLQQEIFEIQLNLAAELGLPVIIHSRQAIQDVWKRLKSWHTHLQQDNSPLATRPGVLHCFSEDLNIALEATRCGFFIGVDGPLTYPNATDLQRSTQVIPLEHILLETDAPYLTPQAHRGQRNEPAYLPLIAEKVAGLRGLSLQSVAQQTSRNAHNLFLWKESA